MFNVQNFLFKTYNATICEMTLQASSNKEAFKLLIPWSSCQSGAPGTVPKSIFKYEGDFKKKNLVLKIYQLDLAFSPS